MGKQSGRPIAAAVVKALDLKEGDEIEISVKDNRSFEVERDRRRLKALEAIRKRAGHCRRGTSSIEKSYMIAA